MVLYIDTTKGHDIEVVLKKNGKAVAQKKITARYAQAEKLLPLIDRILKDNKFNLKDIKKIEVNNNGGSFTALRIGVVTANALGYALGLPVKGELGIRNWELGRKRFNVVEPIYSKEPNITQKKA
jgi:tRNA threonylcarbamoyladenosine biosynthesis protein TsaB